MNDNITPQVIVAWLRGRAKAYNQAADLLEQDLSSNPSLEYGMPRYKRQPNHHEMIPNDKSPFDNQVTLERIQNELSSKKRRVRDLAMHFHVDGSVIEKLINMPDSGIERIERGWLRLKDEKNSPEIEER